MNDGTVGAPMLAQFHHCLCEHGLMGVRFDMAVKHLHEAGLGLIVR